MVICIFYVFNSDIIWHYVKLKTHKAYNKFHVMLQLRCTEKLADSNIN